MLPPRVQRPVFVGGYYIDFETTRSLMAKLEIGDWNYADWKLEQPINNWLFEQKKLHILAGAVKHPKIPKAAEPRYDVDGILLMTRFTSSLGPIKARPKDKLVKRWLIQEGGVDEDKLEWMTLRDNVGLTYNGTKPKPSVRYTQTVWVPTPEQQHRWFETVKEAKPGQPVLTLVEFLQLEEEKHPGSTTTWIE